jgi:hypothetical protein
MLHSRLRFPGGLGLNFRWPSVRTSKILLAVEISTIVSLRLESDVGRELSDEDSVSAREVLTL